MSLTTLVLAAGQGRRFGAKSKLLASLGGRAVLGHVFDRLAEAGLKTGFVALPDDSRFSALKALVPTDFTAVEIDQGTVGMGRSLSAIAQKVPAGNAVLLVLGDQPLLTRTALHAPDRPPIRHPHCALDPRRNSRASRAVSCAPGR